MVAPVGGNSTPRRAASYPAGGVPTDGAGGARDLVAWPVDGAKHRGGSARSGRGAGQPLAQDGPGLVRGPPAEQLMGPAGVHQRDRESKVDPPLVDGDEATPEGQLDQAADQPCRHRYRLTAHHVRQ